MRRDVLDDSRQRAAVDRIGATHALEYRCRRDAVEHRQGVLVRGGCQAEGDVLQHFDQHPAEAEGDQLAERRIGHRADDHFLASGQHLLHLYAEDRGFRVIALRVGHDRVVAFLGFLRSLDPDQHAAGFGLVQDLRRNDLQHDRKPHAGGKLGCVRGRRCYTFLRHRDAVRFADDLALRGGQRGAPFRFGLVENLTHRRLVGCHSCFLSDFAGD